MSRPRDSCHQCSGCLQIWPQRGVCSYLNRPITHCDLPLSRSVLSLRMKSGGALLRRAFNVTPRTRQIGSARSSEFSPLLRPTKPSRRNRLACSVRRRRSCGKDRPEGKGARLLSKDRRYCEGCDVSSTGTDIRPQERKSRLLDATIIRHVVAQDTARCYEIESIAYEGDEAATLAKISKTSTHKNS